MGAFNIPSAADIERLTRRLRSVSQRLRGSRTVCTGSIGALPAAAYRPALEDRGVG